MKKSLLFLPDISGFTEFVQSTEVEHSQHVIAELLEILIDANTLDLTLAEIEGDALFFYKEESVPTFEAFMEQVQAMYKAFYTHLNLLKKHRICPCNACATAPQLELKIIAHSGPIQFITVHGNRKPFGTQVIEAHRLMKNSVPSDNYILLSDSLSEDLGLAAGPHNEQFNFVAGKNHYDNRDVHYLYADLDPALIEIDPLPGSYVVDLPGPPQLLDCREFPISAEGLFEYISNFQYRHLWNTEADGFEFDENEVTKLGSKHVCVVNGQHLDFVTITKAVEPKQLVYGEMTKDPGPVDELYQFFIITPLGPDRCRLEIETFWKAQSVLKKLVLNLVAKRFFKKGLSLALDNITKLVDMSNRSAVAEA